MASLEQASGPSTDADLALALRSKRKNQKKRSAKKSKAMLKVLKQMAGEDEERENEGEVAGADDAGVLKSAKRNKKRKDKQKRARKLRQQFNELAVTDGSTANELALLEALDQAIADDSEDEGTAEEDAVDEESLMRMLRQSMGTVQVAAAEEIEEEEELPGLGSDGRDGEDEQDEANDDDDIPQEMFRAFQLYRAASLEGSAV